CGERCGGAHREHRRPGRRPGRTVNVESAVGGRVPPYVGCPCPSNRRTLEAAFAMPAHQLAPDIPDESSPAGVLAEERAHLARSRAALRAMREHAESLSADVAGDRVSQEILQAALDQRIAALADHADAPLFFGRLDRSAD